jgi:hypothetical protein
MEEMHRSINCKSQQAKFPLRLFLLYRGFSRTALRSEFFADLAMMLSGIRKGMEGKERDGKERESSVLDHFQLEKEKGEKRIVMLVWGGREAR